MGGSPPNETEDQLRFDETLVAATPGLVVVFEADAPACRAVAIGEELARVGRGLECAVRLDDARASRENTLVSRDDAQWRIVDNQSRNGTFVDGEQLRGTLLVDSFRVLRVGSSLLVPAADVAPYRTRASSSATGSSSASPSSARSPTSPPPPRCSAPASSSARAAPAKSTRRARSTPRGPIRAGRSSR